MQTSPSNLIASLYARAADHIAPRPRPEPAAAPAADSPVSGVQDFLATLRQSEAQATAALTGKADPQSVVMALASTELAVEAAVTIRDKVVEAYQEILRMPV
ncbi:MAG: flagellar hook-basal body complex protein FliE [Alphaproteobacteria bacterium]|nr:MAG: flagellar hook-basal body complex protein FliE [Alphaproteobacteria bacterium]